MRTNNNVIGYLEKKHFFDSRPSVSPSRFPYASNTTPEKHKLKDTPSSRSQLNLASTTVKINRKTPASITHGKYSTIGRKDEGKRVEGREEKERKGESGGGKLFDSSRVEIKMCLE